MKLLSRLLRLRPLLVIVGLVGGMGFGLGVYSLASAAENNPQPSSSLTSHIGPTYPVNGSGETYGSEAQAQTLSQEPNLISVVATNGEIGYVLASQLNEASGANVSSATDAAAWDASGASESHTIPVYETDGTTVIGSFAIEPSRSGSPPSISPSAGN